MLSNERPAVGKLLLSEPFMADPNFKRSVICIAEHNELGSVGFILNQKSGFLLSDLIDDFEYLEYQVYNGGPVAADTLHFIHTLGDQICDCVKIGEGIFWGGSFESLRVLFAKGLVPEDRIKFFMGYSGWACGQLDQEIEQNSWIVTESKSQFIFADSEKELWKETVRSMGVKYAPLVHFPENPNLN